MVHLVIYLSMLHNGSLKTNELGRQRFGAWFFEVNVNYLWLLFFVVTVSIELLTFLDLNRTWSPNISVIFVSISREDSWGDRGFSHWSSMDYDIPYNFL